MAQTWVKSGLELVCILASMLVFRPVVRKEKRLDWRSEPYDEVL